MMSSPFLGAMSLMKGAEDTTPSLKLLQATDISKYIKHVGNVYVMGTKRNLCKAGGEMNRWSTEDF